MAGKPITFRRKSGENPRIDGSITIWNSSGYVIFRDLELFNSNPKRISSQTGMGFDPTDIQIMPGFQSYSPNVSLINLVIHDQTRHGIYISSDSANNLIYGCVIYNNGWRSPDNAEGHSVYIQGSSGVRELSDNLLFNSSGAGMHVYDNGGNPVVGVTMDGNVAWNAGAIQNIRSYRDWVVGADSPSPNIDGIVFKNNLGYLPPGSAAYTQVQIGRQGINGSLVMTGNYMPMGLVMNNWLRATVTGNVFTPRNSDYAVDLQQGLAGMLTALTATWNNNTYSRPTVGNDFRLNSTAQTFSVWKTVTGFDSSSTDTPGNLSGTKVFVQPNRYETARANIIVYNWDRLSSVAVDVSSVLPVNTVYEVRNVQDFLGQPVLSGTYNGQPLQLPMTGLTVAAPLGGMLTPPPIGPTFNVFVLLPLSSATNTPPRIASILDQTITVGASTGPLFFTVSDAESAANNLTVSASSSDLTLVPNGNIGLAGNGTNRTVTVTPAAGRSGAGRITLQVSDGQLTSSTSFVLTVNPSPASSNLTFAAGSGLLSGPFVLTNGYVYQSIDTGVTNGGQATYGFIITNAGKYVVQVAVNAPDAAANSIYLNIDAQPQDPSMIWDIPLTVGFEPRFAGWRGNGTFDNNQFVPKLFNLMVGTHELIIVGRERNVQLQSFSILHLPDAPRNVRVLVEP